MHGLLTVFLLAGLFLTHHAHRDMPILLAGLRFQMLLLVSAEFTLLILQAWKNVTSHHYAITLFWAGG